MRRRLYLRPGDVIEAEIERIGVLRNPVVGWEEAHGEPAPERVQVVVGSVELVPLSMRSASWESWRSSFRTRPTGIRTATCIPTSSPSRAGGSPASRYLLRSGGKTVLVDTAVGPAGLWGWKPEREEGLLPALADAGVAPEDVDVVFLTHLHVDHVGWNTDRDGRVVFSNARYVAHRDGDRVRA